MHNVGIVFTGKYEAGTTHVCRQLINLIKSLVNHMPTKIGITQIANHEIISLGLSIFVTLQIYTTDPKSLRFEALYQVPPNKAPRSAHQCQFHRNLLLGCRKRSIDLARCRVPRGGWLAIHGDD